MTPIERKIYRRWPYILAVVLIGYSIVYYFLHTAAAQEYDIRFAPNLDAVFDERPIVLVHLCAALTAFLIGVIVLIKAKGKTFHRILGWIWVVAMATTAISSFWITEINHDSYSYIHLLSGWTAISLPMAISAIRWRKNVYSHAKSMTGMFFGAMIIAGLFTFLPGRLMWNILFDITPLAG